MTHLDNSKALTNALHSAITLMWPKRTQQEKLLDLGEQKPWSKAMARKAIVTLSHWLWTEVFIETCVDPATRKPAAERAALRAFGQNLNASVSGRRNRENHPDVAAWICVVAGSVGGSPKTLSNSISTEKSSNPTHRWLRLISRVQAGGVPEDAWLYHRRSVSSVLAEVLAWNDYVGRSSPSP